MTKIYEIQISETPLKEVVLENEHLKVIVAPHKGGRVVGVKSSKGQFLYTTYPQGQSQGSYLRYGGIEEFLEKPPGTLWKQHWQGDIKADSLHLCTRWRSLFIQKHFYLDANLPMMKVDYLFLNLGSRFVKPTFGIHSEIRLSSDLGANRYHIPASGEVLSFECRSKKHIRYFRPTEAWCAVSAGNLLFAQLFPNGLLDGIEISFLESGNYLSLSPLIYYLGLLPKTQADFRCLFYFGEGDGGLVPQLYQSYKEELVSQFRVVSKKAVESAELFESKEAQPEEMETDKANLRRQILREKSARLRKHQNERLFILQLLDEGKIDVVTAIKRFERSH